MQALSTETTEYKQRCSRQPCAAYPEHDCRVSKGSGHCQESEAEQREGPAFSATVNELVALTIVCLCRKLKLNNKKVQQAVVNVDGALELLQASGFELVFDDSSAEPQSSSAQPAALDPAAASDAAKLQADPQNNAAALQVSVNSLDWFCMT